jgi:hypothetical protein
MKKFFVKNWIHFAIIAFFFILTFLYFSPQFNGYGLKQHDVEQYKGMSQETQAFRAKTGEEPLWTNSMFGGMPTTQISVLYPGNFFQATCIGFIRLLGGSGGAIVFFHLIGFYLLALCLRINPLVGLIGAIAVSFSSYEIVILHAGHNSKAMAVAFMAPTIGAFLMAYRRNWMWGSVLSALFMAYQISCNHVQVTYYMGYLLMGLGIFEGIAALRSRTLKKFMKVSACVAAAYGLALFINYGNLTLTNDYVKHTIRGDNDLTINPDGTKIAKKEVGLDKDYITHWSYGVGESFTLISPYVKGSATAYLGASPFADFVDRLDLNGEQKSSALNQNVYWGNQPGTSGPVFIGVMVFFLSVLGLIYLKDRSKWVLLGVSILCLMLSWGKNFMGLTEFFIDHVPGYNKFRTVTIILVIVEFCLPLIAVLFLDQLWKERETVKLNKKPFLIAASAVFVLLLGLRIGGLGDHYTSDADRSQIENYRQDIVSQIHDMDPAELSTKYGVDMQDPSSVNGFVEGQMERAYQSLEPIKLVRQEIFNSSLNTTLIVFIFTFGLMALLFYSTVPTLPIYIGLAILLMLELIPTDLNYLNQETNDDGSYKQWTEKSKIDYPQSAEQTDEQILRMEVDGNPTVKKAVEKAEKEGAEVVNELGYMGEDKRRLIDSYRFSALNFATNYRVYDISGGFNSAKASYFHKSLGGYHGAKLRNIQNLIEFQIAHSNNKVIDMMNVKYIVQEGQVRKNLTACGSAWMVKSVKLVPTADDEILALGSTFQVRNIGEGRMLINQREKKQSTVFGIEKLQYVTEGSDTVEVRLPNSLPREVTALFVRDGNGKTELVAAHLQSAETEKSFKKLVSIQVVDEFRPLEEAVLLQSEASKLSSTKFSGEGRVKMTSYAPNKIIYKAELEDKQFLVFSEIYYKDGWTATVDGKEVDIRKVNYLLRGLEIEKGNHIIEFNFDIPKFHKSNKFAILGTLLIFLAAAGAFWLQRKKKVAIMQG